MVKGATTGDLLNWHDDAEILTEQGGGNGAPLSVTAASSLVRQRIEALGTVCVVGELAEPKLHSSGHFYASLKDETATLSLVAWRSTVAQWAQMPTAGSLLEVHGKLTSYPARSSYQLVVTRLALAGVGVLLQQLEALKQRLAAEGLFESSRKRSLPFLPERIGLITSPTGAVLHDVLHRLQARCPRPVILAPAAVQGPEAPAQIVAALNALNALPVAQRPDVILIVRGGGSLNDLMAFNDERVVRAVAASAIPTISGVGHEPDITLCDFAADVRAPTPTAAAELAVPVRAELLGLLREAGERLLHGTQGQFERARQRLVHATQRLPEPHRQVLQATQRLEELRQRLATAGPALYQRRTEKVQALARVLQAHHPEAPLQRGYVALWRNGVLVGPAAAAGPMEIQFATTRRSAILEA